jgi:hypothetical protein
MDFDKFIKITFRYWDGYLRRITNHSRRGEIASPPDTRILYPSILLCTDTHGFFAAELIGARVAYEGLKLKRHRQSSIKRYLNQFDTGYEKCIFKIDGESPAFRHLSLANTIDSEYVKNRFPFVQDFPSKLITDDEGRDVFSFGDNFKSVRIDECVLVNRYIDAIRVKHILHLLIVRKTLSASAYEKIIVEQVPYSPDDVLGIYTCTSDKVEDHILAGQFANLFLFNQLRETTIGEYLKQHPEFLERALGTKNFIHEPHLNWLEGAEGRSDQAINPDLMIERADGYFDIYDLKTAALDKRSITKGEWRRRRFIDYVEEGIAQLAHYADYFRFPLNLQHAYEKYKIRVLDPKLVLVVGNFENASRDEISEACRRLNNVSIIDYDTLMQLFLMSERSDPV